MFKGVWYAATNFAPLPLSDTSRGHTHGRTDDSMMVLQPMHLEAALLIDGELHEHHWRNKRKYHGRRGGGGRAFVPGICRS